MQLWVPVAFIAVLLWIIGNITDKFLVEKYFKDQDEDTDTNTLFMFSSVFALPAIALSILMGAGLGSSMPVIGVGIFAGIMNGTYLLSYLKAVSRTELSRIIPIAQSVPFFGFIFGWVLLGEYLESVQILAGAIILAGAVVLVYERSTGSFDIRSLVLMLTASAAIALQMALFKMTALETNYWSGVLLSNVGLFLFGLVMYIAYAPWRRGFNNVFLKRKYRVIGGNTVNEINEMAAILVFGAATLLGPLALVQTVTAYQPVLLLLITTLAAKFGFEFLKEDTSNRTLLQKLIGILLIGIGSIVIFFL